MPPATLPASPLGIIVAGQSNAVAAPRETPNRGLSALMRWLGSDIRSWDETAGALATMTDDGAGIRESGGQMGGGHIGSLVARRAADRASATVDMLALCYTSQNIDYFLPESTTESYYLDGSQHATLNNYDLLASYVAASGVDVDLVIYVGNEANAGTSEGDYLTKARALVDAYRVFAPRAHWIWVPPLDVNAAGKFDHLHDAIATLAAERYYVHAIDNRDMEGHTIWYGGTTASGEHYQHMAGYDEVGERIDAMLQGTTRPNVAGGNAPHEIIDVAHHFGYTKSVALDIGHGYDQVSIWQDPYSATSLTPPANPGQVIPSHAAFGGRPAVYFGAKPSVSYNNTSTPVDSSDTYTFVFVGALPNTSASHFLLELNGSGRVGAQGYISSSPGDAALWYAGGTLIFNDAAVPVADTDPHVWMFVVDDANLEGRYYLDGALVDTVAISGALAAAARDIYLGSLLGVVSFFEGHMSHAFISTEAATDQDAADIYAWAVAEFGDIFG